ncbi:MAG: TIGR04283 family arsenosugar biosynthesis glycosyltransferase [Candidatus Brocadiales bacterium]
MNARSTEAELVSVIIPTLDEQDSIAATLKAVKDQDESLEIIVVDGGSRDGTCDIAGGYATVISSRRCRAVQMNTGARHASGGILLFLHGDTTLPQGALPKIREALRAPGVVAGSFSLRFDTPHRFLRSITFFTRFSWWWARYGDQGLFLRREAFEALGGFKEIPIMEDVDIIWRLKRRGRLYIIQDQLVTSARRYMRNGVFRQHALNFFLVVAYHLGVSPERLKQWYDDAR